MAGRRQARRRLLLSEAEVDVLLGKLRDQAIELSADDRLKLTGLVESFAHVVELAAAGRTSEIARLLGIRPDRRAASAEGEMASPSGTASTSEPPSASGDEGLPGRPDAPAAGHSEAAEEASEPARSNHGRRGPAGFGRLLTAHHHHTSLHAGDACPDCRCGRVYKYRPDEFTTISGQAPLVATRHVVDTLRCSLCSSVFKAPLPAALIDDGVEERPLYARSAVAMVVYYRFFAGVPMHRQDRLQRALGVPVPDSSIWDMCERFADVARPVVRALHAAAADARVFYGDDTGATILDTRSKVKKNRKTGEDERRTGCHTTGIIAVTDEDRAITLFATGIHHTGEVMDLVVGTRDPSRPPPVFMGDCIASNTVTTAVVIYAGCNAHAVRRFKALIERYPAEAGFALERYGAIFDHEAHCRKHEIVGEARRQHHDTHSRPLLRQIIEHGDDLLEQRKMEPSSDLAAAYAFVRNNERRLSAFARHPYAPLDNNRCERELKLAIQLRDTARFFRNAIGAGVADVTLTLGATALNAEVNLPEYFTALLRNADDVRRHPRRWLPWCHAERLREIDAANVHGPDPPTANLSS